MMGFLQRTTLHGGNRRTRKSLRPVAETLEGRMLLATPGYDYLLSGYQWDNPGLITYSIAPDGVFWDHGVNNLNAAFNTRLGDGRWQHEIARALATWASVANLNIAQVGDSALPLNAFGQSEGDPRFGDIRFGGFSFVGTTTKLAQTYAPPPNYGTGSGDVEINTSMSWNINSDFDLYSVMLHETGLALGLDEPPNPSVVMNQVYGGVRSGLTSGDVAGIVALYGPRSADSYQSHGQGIGRSTAVDVSGSLDGWGQTTLSTVSLSRIGDTEYFSVVAPAGAKSLQVSAIASGVSLLSPKVTVFDASGSQIDTQGDDSRWGDNVTAHVLQVVPGQRYGIEITGATHDVFAVGAYHLQVGFSGIAPAAPPAPVPGPPAPAPPSPSPTSPQHAPTSPPFVTPVAPANNGAPPVAVVAQDRFEPNDAAALATPLGVISSETRISGLTLDSANDVDTFAWGNLRTGIYQVSAPGTTIRVFNGAGRLVAEGTEQVIVSALRPRSRFSVAISSPGGAPVASYELTITPPAARVSPALLLFSRKKHTPRIPYQQLSAPRFH